MSFVLDAGCLIALDRGDRRMIVALHAAVRAGERLVTHGGIVGQVWRDPHGRQALLARALEGISTTPLDLDLAKAAGVLQGLAGTSDVHDAALVLLAEDHDRIITSDPQDIAGLVESTSLDVEIVPV